MGAARDPQVTVVTRFAPSPTGYLHLGHVLAARVAAEAAANGGRYLVRVEDIDPARCRPEFRAALLEDLAWLGLAGEGAPRVQSEHLDAYAAALGQLRDTGVLYPCFCSRAEIAREVAAAGAAPHDAARGPDGAPVYPGTCRRLDPGARAARLAAGAPHAWRLDMAAALARVSPGRFFEEGLGWIAADPAGFGDVVLGRRDLPASYHLCVTHDDALQGVTLVTRAEDLRPATHLHVLLQALLGWETPRYRHHRLLLGPDGARLSKRNGAEPVRALRARGVSAAQVRTMAWEGVS